MTTATGVVLRSGHSHNEEVQCLIRLSGPECAVVFEKVAAMGRVVGKDVFETVFATGRMYEAAVSGGVHATRITRGDIKKHLCAGVPKAKDKDVRAALIRRYGGIEVAIGSRAKPGPLYSVKGHAWSALAVAVTWADRARCGTT